LQYRKTNAATEGRLVVQLEEFWKGNLGLDPFGPNINLIKYRLLPPGGDTKGAFSLLLACTGCKAICQFQQKRKKQQIHKLRHSVTPISEFFVQLDAFILW